MLKNNNTVVQAVFYYCMVFVPDNQLLFPPSFNSVVHAAMVPLTLCVWLGSGTGNWRVGCVRGEVSSIRGRFGKWEHTRRCTAVSGIDVLRACWGGGGSGDHELKKGWKDPWISCWYRCGLQSLGFRYVHRHCKPYCAETISLIFQVIMVHVSGAKSSTLPFPRNMGIYYSCGALCIF